MTKLVLCLLVLAYVVDTGTYRKILVSSIVENSGTVLVFSVKITGKASTVVYNTGCCECRVVYKYNNTGCQFFFFQYFLHDSNITIILFYDTSFSQYYLSASMVSLSVLVRRNEKQMLQRSLIIY